MTTLSINVIFQLTKGFLLGEHTGRVVVVYFEPERIEQDRLPVHLYRNSSGRHELHTAGLTETLASPAHVEQGEVHVVQGDDLDKFVGGALGPLTALFPRFGTSRVTVDVEKEYRMGSVVLQSLSQIFSSPVLQLTDNPATEKVQQKYFRKYWFPKIFCCLT